MAKIEVKGTSVTVISGGADDYISLTDIARYKDSERTDYIIQNWLRSRNTIEFLGIWEQLNNPGFNPIEFDGIRTQAGLNSFVLTSGPWIEANLMPPQLKPQRINRIFASGANNQNMKLADAGTQRLKGKRP